MRDWGHDYAAHRNALPSFFDRSFPADFTEALTDRPPRRRAHPRQSSGLQPSDPGGGEISQSERRRASEHVRRRLSGAESRIAEIEAKYMRAPHGSELWIRATGPALPAPANAAGILAAHRGARAGTARRAG